MHNWIVMEGGVSTIEKQLNCNCLSNTALRKRPICYQKNKDVGEKGDDVTYLPRKFCQV